MDATRITPKPNGPLIVEGPVRVVTPDGRELPVPPRKDGRPAEVVVLCRCGGAPAETLFVGKAKRDGFTDPPPPPPPPPPTFFFGAGGCPPPPPLGATGHSRR